MGSIEYAKGRRVAYEALFVLRMMLWTKKKITNKLVSQNKLEIKKDMQSAPIITQIKLK